MATGTGNLPYSMPPVSPFDVITSQAENERIANIKALADGTGIGDNAITASKLDFATLNFRPIASGVATLPSAGASNESSVTVTIPTQANTSYMIQLTGQHGGAGTGHATNTILYRNKAAGSFQIYSFRTVATTPQEVSYIVYRSM